MIRRAGSARPDAINAERTRSRASETALSGSPTIEKVLTKNPNPISPTPRKLQIGDIELKPLAYSYLRISSGRQLKGHGRERQLQASRDYAEANDLELAEGRELEDIGKSAFTGANVREGALGRFLEAVRAGAVKRGSYLLVESLDRLSREQIIPAQSLFLSIVNAGVNIVTLIDGRVYRAGMNDIGDLIVSLIFQSQAHEESYKKSVRLKAKWKAKRESAEALKPMTKWCPAWLRRADDKSCYLPIQPRVDVVRQIFADSANGVGNYKIAHRLNQTRTPTFSKSDGWHQSYIAKILANRAVLGEFQLGIRREGKRVFVGDPVKNYFPAIIDEELFYRARYARSRRHYQGEGAGRKGEAFSNLFSGLATCSYCGSSMKYDNKGKRPKGYQYLVCTNAARRLGCHAKRWSYRDFETSFLAFVSEIDLTALIGDDESQQKEKEAALKVSALEGEIGDIVSLMEKTYQLLTSGAPAEFISSKLQDLQVRKDQLSASLVRAIGALDTLQAERLMLARSKDEIKVLVQRLQAVDHPKLFELRAKIATHLKAMIETLTVAPQGRTLRITEIAGDLRAKFGTEASEVADALERRAHTPEQSHRYFSVGFRDGRVRIVFPDVDDPLRYKQQVVAKAGSTFPHIDREHAEHRL